MNMHNILSSDIELESSTSNPEIGEGDGDSNFCLYRCCAYLKMCVKDLENITICLDAIIIYHS